MTHYSRIATALFFGLFANACANVGPGSETSETRVGQGPVREGDPRSGGASEEGSSVGAATTPGASSESAGAADGTGDPRVPPRTVCERGQTECTPGVCVDLRNDAANCGACGFSCDGATVCSEGRCVRPSVGGSGMVDPSDPGCRANADCDDGSTTERRYCAFEVGACIDPRVPAYGSRGRCVPVPDCSVLDRRPIPVCGCDGRTYDSDCDAAAAGVSVARTGACNVRD